LKAAARTKKQKMHILQCGTFETTRTCGVANAGAALIVGLKKLGHHVTVISPSTDVCANYPMTVQYKHVSYYRRRKYPLAKHTELQSLVSGIHNMTPINIAHIYSVFTPENYILTRVLNRASIPFIWSPQGGLDPCIMRRGRLKKMMYWSLFERKIMRLAAGVHCLTGAELVRVRELGYRGRYKVIANGIETPDEVRQTMGNSTRKIIYLGRGDIEHKGLDRLLRLFSHVHRQMPGAELHLYGCLDAASKLRELMESLNLPERVVAFHPPVYGAQKRDAFLTASLYIQPSRWEGFGISIAEAMAHAVPVAMSRECGLSSFLQATDSVLVLEDFEQAGASQVLQLLQEPERNQELGAKGRGVCMENFVLEAVSSQMEAFYREILQANANEDA
jgi:glycosyltransferase involved in cell wall biosynthesis